MSDKSDFGDYAYDRVTQASMNGLYVKAQELDKGYCGYDAPQMVPAGVSGNAALSWDAATRASDAEAHASDVGIGARADDSSGMAGK